MGIYAWAKVISTVLLASVIYCLGLLIWLLLVDSADSVVFLLFFCHSFIHYMFFDFIVVYYFILHVTLSHIIIVKSVIVVMRKQSLFVGGLNRCDIIIGGGAAWCDAL